jgi:hypothetical protein
MLFRMTFVTSRFEDGLDLSAEESIWVVGCALVVCVGARQWQPKGQNGKEDSHTHEEKTVLLGRNPHPILCDLVRELSHR